MMSVYSPVSLTVYRLGEKAELNIILGMSTDIRVEVIAGIFRNSPTIPPGDMQSIISEQDWDFQ